MMIYDIIILGSGPAGMNAALYAKRYGLNLKIFGTSLGMIVETGEVENYLGIYPVNGIDLADKFNNHLISLGVTIDYEEVIELNHDKEKNIFSVRTRHMVGKINEYSAKTIIYALGGKKRKLGLLNEEKFAGKGVCYCSTCDAPLFKNKVVAITGGANSAVEAAIHLSSFAKKVYLIYRGDKLRADYSLLEKAKSIPIIETVLQTDILELKGDKKLSGIAIAKTMDNKEDNNKNNKKDAKKVSKKETKKESKKETKKETKTETKTEISLDGLFVEYGYESNVDFAKSIGLDILNNQIKVNIDQSTNVEGAFGAGDCTNGMNGFKQVITAVAQGALASRTAYNYLISKGENISKTVNY